MYMYILARWTVNPTHGLAWATNQSVSLPVYCIFCKNQLYWPSSISHDLSWTSHVVEVVNKTNKVLGLIKRTIGSVNKEIFSTLYKALVRPILEYASPAWCPYLVKNIVLLEKVQRRASRLALGQGRGEMSYEDRCKLLRWSHLTDRRLYFSLIECYKFVFGLNSFSFRDFFEFASRRTRSNHNYKLQVKSANCIFILC